MDPASGDKPGEKSLELAGRQRVVVQRSPDGDIVQFLSRNGQVTLSVQVTEDGPVLRFEGASLVLRAAGSLSIEAEDLRLHGRSGVSLSTHGDLAFKADGDLTSEARIQNVTATLGDVTVRANDDVRMQGERIRMNC